MPEPATRRPLVLAAVALVVLIAVAGAVVVGRGLGRDAGPSTGATAPVTPRPSSSSTSSPTPSAAPAPTTSAAVPTPSAAPVPPSGPLTLVGLGDSVPAATTCGCTSFVDLLGSRLEALTGHSWVVHNDSHDAWTTANVEADLATPATRQHLAAADLVVLEVGANDVDLDKVPDPTCFPAAASGCYADTLSALGASLTSIVGQIRALDHRPDLRIALLGYWNVTVDGQVGQQRGDDFVVGSDDLTKEVNATIEQVAVSTRAVYVDAYTPLKGASGTRDPTGDLLADGDHLDASGHARMAATIVTRLERDGALPGWGG
ncbi:MAG: SGNH/GDSL hydrolase family protein [Humibacillus sp.]